MADAKKCDICGKLYGMYNTKNNKNAPNMIRFGSGVIGGGLHYYDWMDICPDCMNHVKNLLAALSSESGMDAMSDGYHTFWELYDHRAKLFAVICNEHKDLAWKSKLHHTGGMYKDMFIVGIDTPEGQATYHYNIDHYWDLFEVKVLDRAPEWDGHTPSEAIDRILSIARV